MPFFKRALALAAFALGIIASGPSALEFGILEAKAQSRACLALERRLASTSGGTSQRAVRAQQRQLASLNRQMSRKGCAQRRRFFQREAHSSCRTLRSRRDRAQRNLNALREGSGGLSRKARARIQREMQRRGCGTRQAINRRTPLLDQIFGRGALKQRQKEVRENRGKRTVRLPKPAPPSFPKVSKNAVRTMCVRRCDGYFFPVNLSGSAAGENAPQEACNNLCPGRDMALYKHKPASQSVAEMVSHDRGEPYTALKNAFAFRQAFNPACSCNYALLTEKGGRAEPEEVALRKQLNEAATLARVALPVFRGDASEDSETAANRRHGLTADAIRKLASPNNEGRAVGNKRVRIIGDAYFPGQ
ncbi:MAG: DUF2865 domain-containing protein [Pseudomonadota bacterium]